MPAVAFRDPLCEPAFGRAQVLPEDLVERRDLLAQLEHQEVELAFRIADMLIARRDADRGTALGAGHVSGAGEVGGHSLRGRLDHSWCSSARGWSTEERTDSAG